MISKGLDFLNNTPSIEIDLPNRGAVVRDVKISSKNVDEVEVTFVTESGVQTPPIRGSPTDLSKDQFPTEKVRDIIITILNTTDNAAPEDVVLSIIVCGEDLPATTVTGNQMIYLFSYIRI